MQCNADKHSACIAASSSFIYDAGGWNRAACTPPVPTNTDCTVLGAVLTASEPELRPAARFPATGGGLVGGPVMDAAPLVTSCAAALPSTCVSCRVSNSSTILLLFYYYFTTILLLFYYYFTTILLLF